MRSIAAICTLLISLSRVGNAADNPTAEELIAKHLDSIGTAEARAAVKSRGVQGALHFKDLAGKVGDEVGYWGLVSEQHKSNFVMKWGSGEWRGERFVFDGDKTNFAVFTSSHRPSAFGDFVRLQDFILKEGLLGGEFSTNWALANLDHSKAKLNSAGLKKVDGTDLDCIEYASKANDMTVKIYFEPETHHHVLTVYSLVVEPVMGPGISSSSRQLPIRHTIEERFSDFQTANGITLPRHYDLRYTQETQTRNYEWNMSADKVLDNIPVDPANFQIK
jgi:hypothetical protein